MNSTWLNNTSRHSVSARGNTHAARVLASKAFAAATMLIGCNCVASTPIIAAPEAPKISASEAAMLEALASARRSAASLPSFPGAEGFGARATGGRGGEVYHVINLNDSGPGSFRDAVSKGPRIVVFDVGGYIELKTPVSVASNITIAGQTAPGDGIGLRNQQVSFSGSTNVIVRYIRVRKGVAPPAGKDGIGIEKGRNMIFDHVSVSWGQDEVFSINNSHSMTVQHSIIAEGLLPHSMGGLIQWNTITMHHNLYAANNDRNPKAKGVIDFVNNVVYNWGSWGLVGDSAGRSDANVVANYFIAGPATKRLDLAVGRTNANWHMFMGGNYLDINRNGLLDGRMLIRADVHVKDPQSPVTWQERRYDYPPVKTESAPDAYRRVLASAGASRVRDAIDRRIVEDVARQTGKIITNPDEVGGFGTLKGGVPPTDTDRDGMPDAWERANKLNPKNGTDARGDADGDGYTNIEEYINGLVG